MAIDADRPLDSRLDTLACGRHRRPGRAARDAARDRARRRRRAADRERRRQRRRARHGRQRHRRRRARRARPARPARAGRRGQGLRRARRSSAPRTLVFAISFSGDTEETVEAPRSAARAGRRPRARCTPAGRWPRWPRPWRRRVLCRRPDASRCRGPPSGRWWRPCSWCARTSACSPAPASSIAAAVAQLAAPADDAGSTRGERGRRSWPATHRPHHAARLRRRAASARSPPIRWKNQVNENAKAPAFCDTLPELCHNEICGWGQHGDVTRQVFTLVELRHDFEHPQDIGRRFELIDDQMLDEVVQRRRRRRGRGRGPLAQLLDLVLRRRLRVAPPGRRRRASTPARSPALDG